jgi:hypothetical protein
MIGKILLIMLLFMGSSTVVLPLQAPAQQTGPVTTSNTLVMTKLKTNATAISACTLNIARPDGTITKANGTLFGKIRIVLNVTWYNSNQTYTVQMANFFQLVTQKNIVVANTTNTNQNQNPTNLITQVTLFPNIPVILILSFKPVCVAPGNLARLIYIDGNYNFVFDLP